MSLVNKLKSLFSGRDAASEPAKNPVRAEEIEEQSESAPDERALEEARRQEEALLDKLAEFEIVGCESLSRSFLNMRIYRFERPFDGAAMRTLIGGMRWLGFRLYTFSVRIDGEEIECESWHMFIRHLAESSVESCSLLTSFGGVRVNCTIDAEGSVHFSHDSSRGVDFSPFEGIFDPEEIEPEEE